MSEFCSENFPFLGFKIFSIFELACFRNVQGEGKWIHFFVVVGQRGCGIGVFS